MISVPMSEIANRLVLLQNLLQKHEVDAVIIRQNADLFYFTGTVQDAYLIVPASGAPVFLVRRDVERATEQSPIRPVLPLRSVKEVSPRRFLMPVAAPLRNDWVWNWMSCPPTLFSSLMKSFFRSSKLLISAVLSARFEW